MSSAASSPSSLLSWHHRPLHLGSLGRLDRLQLVDGLDHLHDLIPFGLGTVLLDVDPGIARPGRLVDTVAAHGPCLAELAEEVVPDLARLAECHARWIGTHRAEDGFNIAGHVETSMILLMILSSCA